MNSNEYVAATQLVKAGLTEHEYKVLVSNIANNAEVLAQAIHLAGMAALKQANEFNNMAWGIDLVKAVGNKHAGKRVQAWLVMFGKFKMKGGEMVAAAKKPLPDNWEETANEMPYWEAFTEPDVKPVELDYLKMIKAIIAKQGKLEQEGKEYTETNVAVKEKLQAILTEIV